jgi:membrane protease YdiL (CAAX protease family)
MSQAADPSATTRRENILVLVLVLAPIGLAAIIMAVGVSAMAAWQIVHRAPVELPTPANIRFYGLLSYAIASWIDVAVVWLWSSHRGLSREVFLFRRLTWSAVIASIVGCVIAMYGTSIVIHWVSHLTGGRGPEVRLNDMPSIVIYLLLFAVTTPLSEEILYRGLLVAWLRRLGWRDSAIWMVGSFLFAANHWIPLGFVWGAGMVVLGAVLFAIRLRYDSLSPAWLTHFLFNAQPFLFLPLIAWLAPVLLP